MLQYLACHSARADESQCNGLIYAVQDSGLNTSQFFTINPSDNFKIAPLGNKHPGYDIEGLDIHPTNGNLLGSSGNDPSKNAAPGHLYQVNKTDGSLISIGDVRFEYAGQVITGREISSLSFHPNGELWGWAEECGLLKIDTQTGKAELKLLMTSPKACLSGQLSAGDLKVEDITWDNQGEVIYAAERRNLWAYTYKTGEARRVMTLPAQFRGIEMLEMLPNDLLLVGVHGSGSQSTNALTLKAINPLTGNIEVDINLNTAPYYDVEGVAWAPCASSGTNFTVAHKNNENEVISDDNAQKIPDSATTVTVDPEIGGTLRIRDDLVVEIPAGAVTKPTVLWAEEIKTVVEVLDPDTGEIVEKDGLSSIFKLVPDGTTFAIPVKIQMSYNPEMLMSGYLEENLVIFQNGESIPSVVNTGNHTVTAQINHFSDYTVSYDLNDCEAEKSVNGIDGIKYRDCTNGNNAFHTVLVDRSLGKDGYELRLMAEDSNSFPGWQTLFKTHTVKHLVETHIPPAIVAINGYNFGPKGIDYTKSLDSQPITTVIMNGSLKNRDKIECDKDNGCKDKDEVFMAFGSNNRDRIAIERLTQSQFEETFQNEFGVEFESTAFFLNECPQCNNQSLVNPTANNKLKWVFGSRTTILEHKSTPNKIEDSIVYNSSRCKYPGGHPSDSGWYDTEIAAIGYSDDKIIFVASDHKDWDDVANYRQICDFMWRFGIVDAVDLDGSDSSQLVVNGELKNPNKGGWKTQEAWFAPEARHVSYAIGLVAVPVIEPPPPEIECSFSDLDQVPDFDFADSILELCNDGIVNGGLNEKGQRVYRPLDETTLVETLKVLLYASDYERIHNDERRINSDPWYQFFLNEATQRLSITVDETEIYQPITRRKTMAYLAKMFYGYTGAEPEQFLFRCGITKGKHLDNYLIRAELATLANRARNKRCEPTNTVEYFSLVTQKYGINAHYLEAGKNVNVWSYDKNDPDQRWDWYSESNLRRYGTNLCLNAHNPSEKSNVNLGTCDSDDPKQQWKIIFQYPTNQDIKFSFQLIGTNYCLKANGLSNDSNLELGTCNEADPNQLFEYIYINEPLTTQAINNGLAFPPTVLTDKNSNSAYATTDNAFISSVG